MLSFFLQVLNTKNRQIIAAGAQWPKCHTAIVALSASGSLGEQMFACKLVSIVGEAVRKNIEQGIATFKQKSWTEKSIIMTRAVFNTCRDLLYENVLAVQGVEQIPSKRLVDLTYRSHEIAQVSVTCLLNECEVRLMAEIKAVAVNAGVLTEMNAETLLRCTTLATDKALKIDADFVLKVA